MTRTLSVAGTLAILILALWIVQVAKAPTPVFGAPAHAPDTLAPSATPAADVVATAVDELAAWPIAAGR